MSRESNIFSKLILLMSALVISISCYFLIEYKVQDKIKYDDTSNAPVNIGGDFELLDLNGNIRSTKEFTGRYKLIYFGFTYCPDICPDALNRISNIIDDLSEDNDNGSSVDIVPIFITIDPARDHPDMLKNYLAHFNANIIGMTGSEDDVRKVADQFKVYYAKVSNIERDESEYLVDHTSFIYFLDYDSKYIKHFPSTDPWSEISQFIKNYDEQ
jgi:protein SCO1/2